MWSDEKLFVLIRNNPGKLFYWHNCLQLRAQKFVFVMIIIYMYFCMYRDLSTKYKVALISPSWFYTYFVNLHLSMIRLFESKSHTETYAKCRPTLAPGMVVKILDFFHKQSPIPTSGKHQLMVDVGCGNGQSTGVFSPYFDEVIGTDISPNQVENASRQFPNVSYKVGSGECLPVKNESVDLILSCQAVHWFDLKKFLGECARALKPNGCLALVGYVFDSEKPISIKQGDHDVMKNIFREFETNCKMHPRCNLLANHYKDLLEQIEAKDKLYDEDLKEFFKYTLEDHKLSMSTWSGYQIVMQETVKCLQEKHGPENVTEEMIVDHDILENYLKQIKKAAGLGKMRNEDIVVNSCRNWFMIVCSRPVVPLGVQSS